MRVMLFLILALFLAAPLHADTFVYLSQSGENAIGIYRMNPDSGELTAVETMNVGAAPGCLNPDPKRQYLFASLRSTSAISSYKIDPKSGKLTLINSTSLAPKANAAYVNTDRQGKFLFSASYTGGTVCVHAIGPDGKLGDAPLQTIETARTAHSTLVDADNRFVFVPHVSPNAVFQFRIDPATGKLTDIGNAPGGKEKAGPRHLAFHPAGKHAFTSDESGSSITLYAIDPASGLKPLKTVSTLPADYTGRNTTAEVKVHPSGKFVWVSNRGHDSLAGFRFDAATGTLDPIGQAPTEKTPRSFDVEPSGKFVFSGGEGSGKLVAYRVDENTGALTTLKTYDIGKAVNWVSAIRIP